MLYSIQEQPAVPAAPPGQPGATPPADSGFGFMQLFPIALIIVVFYFLIIRPQQKTQRQRDELLKQIKKNDKVVTSGGIYGIVHQLKDNEVILLIDEKNDVKIRIARSHIAGVEKVSGAPDEKHDAPKEEAKK